MAKNDTIRARISEEEKKELENEAQQIGLDSLSAYLLMIIRNRKRPQ